MVGTTAKWTWLGVIFGAVSAGAQASGEITRWPEVSAKIDQIYAEYDSRNTPGGVVAVLHRGEVVHLKGYGVANRELGIPWPPDTRYRVHEETERP